MRGAARPIAGQLIRRRMERTVFNRVWLGRDFFWVEALRIDRDSARGQG